MCIRGNVCLDGMHRYVSTQRIRILRPSKKSVVVFECVCEIIYLFCLFIFAFLHLFLLFQCVWEQTDGLCVVFRYLFFNQYGYDLARSFELRIAFFLLTNAGVLFNHFCSIHRSSFCLHSVIMDSRVQEQSRLFISSFEEHVLYGDICWSNLCFKVWNVEPMYFCGAVCDDITYTRPYSVWLALSSLLSLWSLVFTRCLMGLLVMDSHTNLIKKACWSRSYVRLLSLKMFGITVGDGRGLITHTHYSLILARPILFIYFCFFCIFFCLRREWYVYSGKCMSGWYV